jgi:hypothetical protein
MKMKKRFVVATFILFMLPFILADIAPLPGEKDIPINNQITNIGEFPNYIFFATADNENPGPGFRMCPLEIVSSNGSVIYNYYKLCSISIYAVLKTDMTESKLKEMNETELRDLVNSTNVVKVLSKLKFSERVSLTAASQKSVTHSIDASKLKPVNENQPQNNHTNQTNQNNENSNTHPNNQSTKICPEGSSNENGSCMKLLSNGIKAEVKIMPETIVPKAAEKLGLKFDIQLKEVGNDADIRPVYVMTGNKEGKFLGIFKITAKIQAQADAKTGDIKIIKPWWAFLASGI